MRIVVEGCAHGELEIIYETILRLEKINEKKVDLLICCGDFQSTRNLNDLKCMAVPDKYKSMCSFYKYYSGEKIAPVLTIFIGGNHEASNYLQELPYGGWVAPNIYYLGYAGVVTIAGIRIAGISGIYKGQNWMQGHFEKPPYNHNTLRSVYHVRNLEIFRLKQISSKIDIFLSHDWPSGVTKYGDENSLLRNKPFFRQDIENNALGSHPCMELLRHHYPSYWFSAHLHCKFAALIHDENGGRVTKFLALDKCLPKRKFLQVLEIDHDASLPLKLSYDLEWLTILFLTNHLLSVKEGLHYMPGPGGNGRWIYTPSDEEKQNVLNKFHNNLEIPENFEQTAEPYTPLCSDVKHESLESHVNGQTTQFCNILGVDDPAALLQMMKDNTGSKSIDSQKSDSYLLDDSNVTSEYCDFDSSHKSILQSSDITLNEPEDSPKHTGFSRLLIDLPPPKNEHLTSSVEIAESEAITTEIEIPEVLPTSKDEVVPVEPNCKKFKRRNHSFYSTTM